MEKKIVQRKTIARATRPKKQDLSDEQIAEVFRCLELDADYKRALYLANLQEEQNQPACGRLQVTISNSSIG